MKQQTLAIAADQQAGFERYRRPTKRDVFLQAMEAIMPWSQLCEVIEPNYPKGALGANRCCLKRTRNIVSTSATRGNTLSYGARSPRLRVCIVAA